MPIGLKRLLKEKPEETDFEKYISNDDFESAANELIKKGYTKLADQIIDISDALVYVSFKREEEIKKLIIDFYKEHILKAKSKNNTLSFSTIESAMAFLKKKVETKDIEEEIDKQSEKEKSLLKSKIGFKKIDETFKNTIVGLIRSDIIIIGKVQQIKNALHDYNYIVDKFSYNQLIIRNVLLIGMKRVYFRAPKKRGETIFKNKTKKDQWIDKSDNQKIKLITVDHLADIISRNKVLNKFRIASNKPFYHEDFVYFPLLPPTIVSLPFCEQKRGMIIPLINEWSVIE